MRDIKKEESGILMGGKKEMKEKKLKKEKKKEKKQKGRDDDF